MNIINVKGTKKVLGKSQMAEYPNQIVFLKDDIEVDMDKDVVDIMLSDNDGNTIGLYERNGAIRKIASSRSISRKMRKLNKLSKLLIENISKIYDIAI